MPKSVTLSYREAMRRLSEMPESAIDGTYVNKPLGRPRKVKPKEFNPLRAGFTLAIMQKHIAAANAVLAVAQRNPATESALDNLALSAADMAADIATIKAKLDAAAAKRHATCAARPPKPDKWQYLINGRSATRARAAAELCLTEESLRVAFSRSGGAPLQRTRQSKDGPAYILEVARVLHNASTMPKPEKRDRRTKRMKMDNQVGGGENPAGGA